MSLVLFVDDGLINRLKSDLLWKRSRVLGFSLTDLGGSNVGFGYRTLASHVE